MFARSLLAGLVAFALVPVTGCNCGEHRERGNRRPSRTAEPAEPSEPAEEPPPPARAKEHTPAPTDPRFGTASITFSKVDDRPHAAIRVAIPEGADVHEGATQRAAIYFDQGPPISAPLTAHDGAWQSADLRLPPPVEAAAQATLKIPTTPQTTFIFEMSGAWNSAATAPVTLESGR